MRKISLILKIFIALVLGISLGLLSKSFNLVFPIKVLVTFSTLFSNFLSFVIPLIIIGFIVPGIASLGNKSSKGLLVTTIVSYSSTIISGIVTFIIGSNLLPYIIKKVNILNDNSSNISPYFSVDIPPLMSVMTALVFAFIFGIGISTIQNSSLLKISQEFNKIISIIISKVLIPLMPIYILSIFSKLSFSGEIFSTLKSFGLTYLILFLLQIAYLIAQYVIAGYVKNENPFRLLKNMIPAYMMALGTQSSAATIPVTLECVKKNNINNEIKDFVIPLAATIHLAGDTITLVLSSMSIMYLNGQVPTLSTFIPFILMLGITMIAAPGVPGGGVMAALGILESMLGFGALEKPLIIALHTAQDSFGTATNVTGDGAISIIVEFLLNKLSFLNSKKFAFKNDKKIKNIA